MKSKILAGLAAAALAASLVPATAAPAAAAVRHFKNCTALNKVYKHGVGKKGARDHVSGSSRPVTTFTRSTAVYLANKSMDRDKDGIACEKR